MSGSVKQHVCLTDLCSTWIVCGACNAITIDGVSKSLGYPILLVLNLLRTPDAVKT